MRSFLRALVPLALATMPARAQSVPEPADLWRGAMHGATPATLKGARVIDAQEFAILMATRRPFAIDVANLQPRLGGRPAAAPQVHRSVPGAAWWPGAGSGTREQAFADAFAARVAAATGGDKDRPIVTFCHPQRWGSWNTAKRLVALGYTHVYWYPGGSEGWEATGKTKAILEDPRWKATGLDKDSSVTLGASPGTSHGEVGRRQRSHSGRETFPACAGCAAQGEARPCRERVRFIERVRRCSPPPCSACRSARL